MRTSSSRVGASLVTAVLLVVTLVKCYPSGYPGHIVHEPPSMQVIEIAGASEEIRTPDPQIRSRCSAVSKGRKASCYLPFLGHRDSAASTLRTSDWEIPNCLAMREGEIPALILARTGFTCLVSAQYWIRARRRCSDDRSNGVDFSDWRATAAILDGG
jgi:hypothetical protein